jgi:transposase
MYSLIFLLYAASGGELDPKRLNAITHEVILVTNDTYITATQVCELLEKIAALGLIIPITLVLDNARYQKCKIVEELALYLSTELLYLPSYCLI